MLTEYSVFSLLLKAINGQITCIISIAYYCLCACLRMEYVLRIQLLTEQSDVAVVL